MTIRPILFNTAMVQAILREEKTATRRPVRVNLPAHPVFTRQAEGNGILIQNKNRTWSCTYYLPAAPGDVLYVRETWCERADEDGNPVIHYLADEILKPGYRKEDWTWRPSIHMPKTAARLFLHVDHVMIQKLSAMAPEDIRFEGIAEPDETKALEQWKTLWNSTLRTPETLKKYGYDADPYICAISFHRCGKPDGFPA